MEGDNYMSFLQSAIQFIIDGGFFMTLRARLFLFGFLCLFHGLGEVTNKRLLPSDLGELVN